MHLILSTSVIFTQLLEYYSWNLYLCSDDLIFATAATLVAEIYPPSDRQLVFQRILYHSPHHLWNIITFSKPTHLMRTRIVVVVVVRLCDVEEIEPHMSLLRSCARKYRDIDEASHVRKVSFVKSLRTLYAPIVYGYMVAKRTFV